tara:strand:- start:218 stop:370 length:153 start_codon:yes stop_codon:yes gene_type:complete
MNSNDKLNEDIEWPTTATKFDEWMRKINNQYYSNHQAMTEAYKKMQNEKI